MTDFKNKIKETAEKAKNKIEESKLDEKIKDASTKAQAKIKEAKLDEKLKNASAKAQTKFKEIKEDEELKSKISKDGIKGLLAKYNISTKVVKVVAIVAVLFLAVCCLFAENKPKEIKIGNKTMMYIFDEDKLFGTAMEIEGGNTIDFAPARVSFDGGISLEVSKIEKTDSYYHSSLKENFENVNYVVTVKNFLLGGNIVMILQETEFKIGDEELTGYNIYSLDEKQKKRYHTTPDMKIIFNNYAEEQKIK